MLAATAMGRNGQLAQLEFPQAVRTTVHIDSRDRDYDMHPSSSSFYVELPEQLKNISSAVLLSAEIPLSFYVFSAARGTSSVTVTWNGTTQIVTIPDGNYSLTTMAVALETALNAAFGTSGFDVAFSSSTLKCTITAPSGVLAIDTMGVTKKTDWGLAYYLGFPRNAQTGAAGPSVTGTTVCTMNPENYLLLDIEELNGLSQSAMYAAGGLGFRSFAKVPLNGDSYQYNYYDKTLTYVELRPQLTKLDKLKVSLRFHDGTLVDLNGAEWSMSLEFACSLTRGL